MSSPIITIADLKAAKNLTVLRVFVHKKLDANTFLVGDETCFIPLKLVEGKITKNVTPGQYIKIVKPELVNDCLELRHDPLYCPPFCQKPLIDDGDASARRLPSSKGMLNTFEDIGKIPVNSLFKVVAKVSYLSAKKPAKFSRFQRTAGVKDSRGQKHSISLFGNHCDNVKEGRVYKFSNLKVTKYKGDRERWNRLGTGAQTKVEPADEEIKNLFANVPIGDGILKGIILGYEDPYCYLSCPMCTGSCANSPCQKCGHVFDPEDLKNDFHVKLCIAEENSEEVHTVSAFKKVLKIEIHNIETVTQALDEFTGKICEIDFVHEKGTSHVRAIAIKVM